MQRTIRILTALALSSGASFAQLEGPRIESPESFEEMVAASRASYRLAGSPGMSPATQAQVSGSILSLSGASLAPQPMLLDGHALFRSSDDASAMLHLDTTKSMIVFNKGMKPLGTLEDTPALPSTEAARGVALQRIEQLELTPLVPDEMVVEHIGGMGMGVEQPDGSTQTFDKLRTVRFGRVVDGKKVLGPGSRIVVQLGREGELHGLVHRWQEFEPSALAAAQKHSPEALREMLRVRLARAASHASEVEFESAELVLYDDGEGVMEPVIRMVYQLTIESRFRGEDGQLETRRVTNPLDFFLPVLKRTQARLPFVKDLQAAAQARPAAASEAPQEAQQADD